MIFTESFRSRLKLAKAYCLPNAIAFQTGAAFLVGADSAIRVDIDEDLFGPVEIPGEMHFEGDGVDTIIDMIVKGANVEFEAGQAVATSDKVRTVFRSVSGPEHRVPVALKSEYDDPVSKVTVDTEIKKFVEGIEFAWVAIRGSKASMFSNRIFLSEAGDRLLVFGTDNAVINVSYCQVKRSGMNHDFTLPGKALYKAAKLLSQESQGIDLTFYRDCAILALRGQSVRIHVPLLMGSVPDYHEIMAKVKACDAEIDVPDVTALIPPKEMLKVGQVAELSLSKTTGIQITILHTGASSLFDTELQASDIVTDVTFKLKKDEFFRCISALSGRIRIRWTDYSPLFVAIQADGKLSVHALELGEWR